MELKSEDGRVFELSEKEFQFLSKIQYVYANNEDVKTLIDMFLEERMKNERQTQDRR
jgi:hypothetical protein